MEFTNHLIQSQWRLASLKQLEAIVKKDGAPLSVKHPQLASIISGLESTSLLTSLSCCSILSSATTLRWLDPAVVMATLVSSAVSSTHVSNIVHVVGELLVGQVSHSVQTFTCPYSLRSNVHPFISIYNSCPDHGLCLVNEVVSMLSTNTKASILTILEPFLKYILLHPTPPVQMGVVSTHLHYELVGVVNKCLLRPGGRNAKEDNTCALLELFVRMIPLQTRTSTTDMLSLVSMVTRLVKTGSMMEKSCGLLFDLANSCLSLISELIDRGLPSLQLISSLVALVEGMDQFGSPDQLLSISSLLLKSLPVPEVVHVLLKLCDHLRSKFVTFGLLFILPLIQLLSQPQQLAVTSCDLFLSNQKMAADLLSCLRECSSPEAAPLSASSNYSQPHSLVNLYVTLSADSAQIVPFLNDYQKELIDTSYEQLTIVLCALAVRVVGDVRAMEGILGTLTIVAHRDPTLAPSLLPFFIHLLSSTTCPHSKLVILHSIPKLATHKLATGAVVNTIRVIGGNPALISMATRLLGWVWEKQDEVFPSLLEYLARPLPRVAKETHQEIDLSRVAVMRDICLKRPEQHGEAVLGLIHKYLSLGGSCDPVLVAMAIEGLVELCRREVVDVVTLWSVIGEGVGRLEQDSRPAVVVTLCSLFGLSADYLNTENNHSHKVFKTKSLCYLFKCVFSGHPNICSAALKSLALFQMTDFTVVLLPTSMAPQFKSHDSLPESHDCVEDVLTGADLVKMFHFIPSKSLIDHTHYISVMLKEEISLIGRGVISTALRQAQVPSQTGKVLGSLHSSLPLFLHQTSPQPEWVWLHRASKLAVFEVKVQAKGQSSFRHAGRQATSKQLTLQLSILEDTLRAVVDVSEVCLTLTELEIVKDWKKFMGGLLSAYTEVYLCEDRVVSVSEGEVADEARLKAGQWAFTQVLEKLQSIARSSPDCIGNVLTALVGVVSYNSSQLIGQPDHVTNNDQSKSLLVELLDTFSSILFGTPTPANTHPTLLSVFTGGGLERSAWFSLSVLVGSVVELVVVGLLADNVVKKLVKLVENMIDLLSSFTSWFVPEVTNQILGLLLPVSRYVGVALDKVIHLISTTIQEDRMDHLCQLSALLPSLCGCGSHVTSVGRTVMSLINDRLSNATIDSLSSTDIKLCCVHMTFGLGVVYSGGGLSDEEAMGYVAIVADLATKAPQESAYHLSLGTVLHTLSDKGHKQALSLSDVIAVRWLGELDEAISSVDYDKMIPLLWGLSSLLGVCPGFWPIRIITRGHSGYIRTLLPLVTSLFERVITAFPESHMAVTSLWLLSQIETHLTEYFAYSEKVPQDYSYLPDSSILPSLYAILEGCHGDTTLEGQQLTSAVLVAMTMDSAGFPPANWSRLLVPCIRSALSFHGNNVESKCIESISGAVGCQQFINYCTHPCVLSHLRCESWCTLLSRLPLIAESFSDAALGVFLHSTLSSPHLLHSLTVSHTSHLLHSLLKGIHATLTLDNTILSPSKKRVVSSCILKLYNLLVSEDNGWKLFVGLVQESLQGHAGSSLWELAKCMSVCDLLENKFELKKEVTLAGCYDAAMECTLVKEGLKRFVALGMVVEWILLNADCPKVIPSFILLLRTISCCCSPQMSTASTLNQIDSLHTLLLWTRSNQISTNQLLTVLLLAHLTTITDLPPSTMSALISLVFSTYPRIGESSGLGQLCAVLQREWVELKQSKVRELLCECLLEWLGLATSDELMKQTIIGILSSQKSTEQYRSPLIWTSVAHLL